MSKTVGIDLGSSRCSVAAVVDGAPRVLLRSTGAAFSPTVVSLTERGLRVGTAAEELALTAPEATVYSLPRFLGRKVHSPETDWLRACVPNAILAAANGDVAFELANAAYSPTELVSFLLEDLRRRAERELGGDVTDAVIAVPACFDELQRRATLDAALLAGFADVRLVNATSAAALAYAQGIAERLRVAIVDFGAGSFTATIADVRDESVEILAIAADHLLGGDDVDKRLVLHLLDEHLERTGVDLSLEPRALAALAGAAKQIKHALSQHTKTDPMDLGALRLGDGRDAALVVPAVSRRQLVELMAHELASMKEPCRWALEDCELGTDDLEAVVLLGGLGRMPAISSAVKYLFRAIPTTPEEAPRLVVEGAARMAAARRGEHPGRLRLRDVTTRSVGVKLRGGRFEPMIRRNHRIPCVDTKMFRSAERGQGAITFELFQGESEVSTENTYLGRVLVSGMTPGAQFGVAFQLDASGILEVSVVDPEAGTRKDVPLQLSGGLNREELVALKQTRAERSQPDLRQPADTPLPSVAPSSVRAWRPGTSPGSDEAPSRRFARPSEAAASSGRRAGGSRSAAVQEPDGLPGAGPSRRRAIEVAADSLVGTVLEGRYEIEKVVADGGMGRVYLARHTLLGRPFAIKVLHPELASNRELAERFLREARAASNIQSSHVVDISDFGSLADGTSYFVMEYLEGKTLESILDERGPLPAGTVRSIGIQVADGLRGAHELRVVHRDLKPANIVLVERPEHPHFCKILDFGIAKSPTSSSSGNTLVTLVGVMMGTPHYMAPEQIDGIEVDGRSDIYALGIVLYEMVTGLPPFDAESVAEVLAQQKWTAPPPIHETYEQADCPPELEAVIRRCLEKDPKDRYQSAQELAGALAGG